MRETSTLIPEEGTPDGRRRDRAFWIGTILTCFGVVLHLPMFIGARDMDFVMAGMAPDPVMITGMVMILIGLPITTYGLFPRHTNREAVAKVRVRALDDAPISTVHVRLLLVMAIAVTIDVMKPTTLAFVVPGLTKEYGLDASTVALLPLVGITGTVIGSFVWGWLGDRVGRKSSMLLAGVVFIATSICGSMPTFSMNLLMCFIMGLGAGGMLPIAFTLLCETIPARHRGWLMVLIGGDVAGAYIITSWLSSVLGPIFGWRILWLLGLPTGILLILLTKWIPESPRYLLAVGRDAEARHVMRSYGAHVTAVDESELEVEQSVQQGFRQMLRGPFAGVTTVLTLVALGIGLVVYGFQMWLPSNLRDLGFTGTAADQILANSALVGFPLNFLVAYFYYRSSRWTLIGLSTVVVLALSGFVALGANVVNNPNVLFVLLVIPIWGASSVVAVLSAYCAEVYPTRSRSRGSGLTAGMTKAGGVAVIAMVAVSFATPSLAVTALLGAIPMGLATIAAIFFAIETGQRSLEEITAAELNA